YSEYDWGFSYGYWSDIFIIKGEVQEIDSDFLRLFRISQLIWDLWIHSKIRPLSLCFHVENSLLMKMKRWQIGLVPVPGEKSFLNIWLATGSPGIIDLGMGMG
ncbi:hypothetical protein ACJX0J_026853, partial [Zea mays]